MKKTTLKQLNAEIKQLVAKITAFDGIDAILLCGQLARVGSIDEYSDIDIEVYYNDVFCMVDGLELIDEIKESELDNRFEIEFFWIDPYLDPNNDENLWTMSNRWDKKYCHVLFDKDRKMTKIIERITLLSDEKIENNAVIYERYAYWYALIVAGSWAKRGDMLSAHKAIDCGIEEMINWLYLINGQFIPHKKWKYNLVKDLKLLPKDFTKKLSKIALIKKLDEKSLNERIKLFANLYKDIRKKSIKKIEEIRSKRYEDSI